MAGGLLAAVLVVVVAAAAGVFYLPEPEAVKHWPPVSEPLRDSDQAVQRLASFLRLKTVGDADAPQHIPNTARQAFQGAKDFLHTTYKDVFDKLQPQTVANWTLLLKWEGSDPSLLPGLMMSHYDVVPADESATSPWTHGPFSGDITDGYLYGRGALDIKCSLIAQLEAVSQLLATGFQPVRTLYMAFGHDEELGGGLGTVSAVQLLQEQGVRLEFVLDEGGMIAPDGMPPLTRTPVALIGTGEKGYTTLEVEVTGSGGHSSMPPIDGTSVAGTLARLVSAVERAPPPLRMAAPTTAFLKALAPAAPYKPLRLALRLADNWFVGPILARVLATSPDSAAMVRTTAAPTMVQSGYADNIMPLSGTAKFNFRLLPGEDQAFAERYLRARLGADAPRATLRNAAHKSSQSALSPSEGRIFDLISRAIQETLAEPQGLVVAPFLLVGATDSRHYLPLTNSIYRFAPFALNRTGGDVKRVHGTDERISITNFVRGIGFYQRFIRLAFGILQGSSAEL